MRWCLMSSRAGGAESSSILLISRVVSCRSLTKSFSDSIRFLTAYLGKEVLYTLQVCVVYKRLIL